MAGQVKDEYFLQGETLSHEGLCQMTLVEVWHTVNNYRIDEAEFVEATMSTIHFLGVWNLEAFKIILSFMCEEIHKISYFPQIRH